MTVGGRSACISDAAPTHIRIRIRIRILVTFLLHLDRRMIRDKRLIGPVETLSLEKVAQRAPFVFTEIPISDLACVVGLCTLGAKSSQAVS